MHIEHGLEQRPDTSLAIRAHLRRRPFLYLSLMLHAALLAALYQAGPRRVELDRQKAERARAEQLVESGKRLTEAARLEKRVHDMARIKSLLEQSADPAAAGKGAPDEPVRFSARPEAPELLLEKADRLSRAIEKIERETRAEELAKLLGIPKKRALEKLEAEAKPAPPTGTRPGEQRDPAKRIAQLETRARAALERRRAQLERQRGGTPVKAGAAIGGKEPIASALEAGPGAAGAPGQGKTGGAVLSAVLADMAGFDNPDLPDRDTKAYTAWGTHDIFGQGQGSIPFAGSGKQSLGRGRILGPGGAYAGRVYVNQWYLIGPFEGKHGAGLFANLRHPPEQDVVLDAAYRGKGGRLLRWEYVDMANYPLVPPVEEEDAVYYGYTELMMDKEQDLTIWVGADDDAQLWLNDRLVWRGGSNDKRWFFGQVYDTWNTHARDYNLSEGKRVVHLRQGRNKLFFKLSNGPTRLFFSLVLTE